VSKGWIWGGFGGKGGGRKLVETVVRDVNFCERNKFANHPVAMPTHSQRTVVDIAITHPKEPAWSLAPPSEHVKSLSPLRRCWPSGSWCEDWKPPARSSFCQSGKVWRWSRKEQAGGTVPAALRRVGVLKRFMRMWWPSPVVGSAGRTSLRRFWARTWIWGQLRE
jgi:hypothetical protein